MSLPQLRRSLLDQRWTLLWFGLGITAYTLLIAAFWPTAKNNAALFSSYISQLPEAFVKAFGIADIAQFEGFIGAEELNFMWPLIVLVFVIMAASSFVAGEIDRGTIELWLSVPVPRWRLLSAKQIALVIGIVVLAAVTVALIAVAARLANESLSTSGLVATGAVLSALCIAVAGYTSLFSSLFSSPSWSLSRSSSLLMRCTWRPSSAPSECGGVACAEWPRTVTGAPRACCRSSNNRPRSFVISPHRRSALRCRA